MSRFAPLPKIDTNVDITNDSYEFGFSDSTSRYSYISKPGLSKKLVEEISHIKNEPSWMLDIRLKALDIFLSKPMPNFGPDLSDINFDAIHYYLRPTDKETNKWEEVPDYIKKTFEKLGTPEAEREMLAGVKNQYDSEVVQGSLKDAWSKQGVEFLSMDEGLKKHPDLVREYFTKLIPTADNKFSALNTAVWSGGSFVYVPKGVNVTMPLQAYFRINAEKAGQFERTLIIADEGSKVHYVEGCFVKGTNITTEQGDIEIQDVVPEINVLTHTGTFQNTYHIQKRNYSGKLYTIEVYGNLFQPITATSEHPFLVVKRKLKNERNNTWEREWIPISKVKKGDYCCYPIDNTEEIKDERSFEILMGRGKKFEYETLTVLCNNDLFKLIGYYLSEGSISSGHYLSFSFSETETEYINEVQQLISKVFHESRIRLSHHKKNHGTSVVVSSTKLCRFFQMFGSSSNTKHIPQWVIHEDKVKQQFLLRTWCFGDGSYFHSNNKDVFRIATVSKDLAKQMQMMLARNQIASSINMKNRIKEHRKTMYTVIIGGEFAVQFGHLVNVSVREELHHKKRSTYFEIDDSYMYMPIKTITTKEVKNTKVYNFSVSRDESYVANGMAVHNCTSPTYSTSSLHSAVVEIFVKKGASVQYTTAQNWYKHVYNLVTKRSYVEEEGSMVWTDFNMGSKVTMKYPSFILAGKGAKGETLSMALASEGQHQDTGCKAIHLAPYTSSTVMSKSISKNGGRTSYRGMVNIGPHAHGAKNKVVCDALILDNKSVSDTYPTEKVFTNDVSLEHEATVSKIGEEQLFYLMSRGLTEEEAGKMIVRGFAEPLVKKLPLEFAVEMNRLIDLEMEGSVG